MINKSINVMFMLMSCNYSSINATNQCKPTLNATSMQSVANECKSHVIILNHAVVMCHLGLLRREISHARQYLLCYDEQSLRTVLCDAGSA